jgi:hypothetical protein
MRCQSARPARGRNQSPARTRAGRLWDWSTNERRSMRLLRTPSLPSRPTARCTLPSSATAGKARWCRFHSAPGAVRWVPPPRPVPMSTRRSTRSGCCSVKASSASPPMLCPTASTGSSTPAAASASSVHDSISGMPSRVGRDDHPEPGGSNVTTVRPSRTRPVMSASALRWPGRWKRCGPGISSTARRRFRARAWPAGRRPPPAPDPPGPVSHCLTKPPVGSCRSQTPMAA